MLLNLQDNHFDQQILIHTKAQTDNNSLKWSDILEWKEEKLFPTDDSEEIVFLPKLFIWVAVKKDLVNGS